MSCSAWGSWASPGNCDGGVDPTLDPGQDRGRTSHSLLGDNALAAQRAPSLQGEGCGLKIGGVPGPPVARRWFYSKRRSAPAPAATSCASLPCRVSGRRGPSRREGLNLVATHARRRMATFPEGEDWGIPRNTHALGGYRIWTAGLRFGIIRPIRTNASRLEIGRLGRRSFVVLRSKGGTTRRVSEARATSDWACTPGTRTTGDKYYAQDATVCTRGLLLRRARFR